MRFEVEPVLIRVLRHCDQQQHLDVEARELRVQQCHLAVYEARFLEIAHASPARGPGHAGLFGEIRLTLCDIALQGDEEEAIGSGQFYVVLIHNRQIFEISDSIYTRFWLS